MVGVIEKVRQQIVPLSEFENAKDVEVTVLFTEDLCTGYVVLSLPSVRIWNSRELRRVLRATIGFLFCLFCKVDLTQLFQMRRMSTVSINTYHQNDK